MSKADQLFETLTAKIVEAIETGNHGKWTKPWTTVIGGMGLGHNVTTKKAYQGMNQLVLMFESAIKGYGHNEWATYKQWKSIDAQVRKGEKATTLIKWGQTYKCDTCGHKGRNHCGDLGHLNRKHMWASAFNVFNAAQVDGYTPAMPEGLGDAPEQVERIEKLIAATGADITHAAQDRAYFMPANDKIVLPLREQFETTAGYYGTALHELTHWTGHESRLAREGGTVFGDSKYAFEELVAELGATFLAAHLGVELEPHMEHAAYLASWLKGLKEDPRALYRASKLAQAAATYLLGFEQAEEEVAA